MTGTKVESSKNNFWPIPVLPLWKRVTDRLQGNILWDWLLMNSKQYFWQIITDLISGTSRRLSKSIFKAVFLEGNSWTNFEENPCKSISDWISG